MILLHGEKGSRINWVRARHLQANLCFRPSAGVGLCRDYGRPAQARAERRAGQAEPVNNEDYFKMGMDLQAVKDFVQKLHQEKKLNMSKMAIVGTGFSAPVAAAFAEVDWKQTPYDDSPIPAMRTPRGQDVKALVLISPDTNAGRLATNRSLTFLNKQNLSSCSWLASRMSPTKGPPRTASRPVEVTRKGTVVSFWSNRT